MEGNWPFGRGFPFNNPFNNPPRRSDFLSATESSPPVKKKSKLEKDLDAIDAKQRMAIFYKVGRAREWKKISSEEKRKLRAEYDPTRVFDDDDHFVMLYNRLCDARPVLLEARAIKTAVADESVNERFAEIAEGIADLKEEIAALKMLITSSVVKVDPVDASKK